MNPTQYETNVIITESTDFPAIKGRTDDRMIRLLHAGLGLSSEVSELCMAAYAPKNKTVDWVNIMEESGDLLWYIAVAINALKFSHEEISSYESHDNSWLLKKCSEDSLTTALSAVTLYIGEYNDLLKKHLFYGRELDMKKMKQILQKLCMAVSGLCFVSGYSIEQARETNINKLKARYGEKFSEAAALTRNLETERKVLEGETV